MEDIYRTEGIFTGLSVKDAIGIVTFPWTDFFLSWTSIRRASPSGSGKLKEDLWVKHSHGNYETKFCSFHLFKQLAKLQVISRERE